MRATAVVTTLMTLAAVSTAAAQSSTLRLNEQIAPGPRPEGAVRVQSNIGFFLPGPTGESEEAVKLRDRARRIVYEMASKECDVLRSVMAKECRLESINASVNRQHGRQQEEGIQVNGSMTLQIIVK